jgi:predicted ATPase
MLELRATMNLVRLQRDHGQPQVARQALAEVYDWFTEGFNTGDLQEANRLLTKGVSDVCPRE